MLVHVETMAEVTSESKKTKTKHSSVSLLRICFLNQTLGYKIGAGWLTSSPAESRGLSSMSSWSPPSSPLELILTGTTTADIELFFLCTNLVCSDRSGIFCCSVILDPLSVSPTEGSFSVLFKKRESKLAFYQGEHIIDLYKTEIHHFWDWNNWNMSLLATFHISYWE